VELQDNKFKLTINEIIQEKSNDIDEKHEEPKQEEPEEK